jgi:hypothetical protein
MLCLINAAMSKEEPEQYKEEPDNDSSGETSPLN